MSRLATLQSGLSRVKRFRAGVRNGSALSVFFCVVLWVLMGAFVLDVMLHMGIIERFLVLAFFAGMTFWAFRKYVMPALRVNEDEIELALMVERQQGIGSDLVAALQFADGRRSQFGSGDLRQAVIDYTDEVSGSLNYLEGFSRDELKRRGLILAITVVVALIPILAMPGHVGAFVNRFFLGSAHYPTHTIIEKIESPGDRAPYGQPIRFHVRVAGIHPEKGFVELKALASGLKTTVDLVPDEKDVDLYVGELPRALDDISYIVRIGDAYTDSHKVELIPLPIVELKLAIETPAYALDRFQSPETGRQRVALENSRVVPTVTADKPLKSATITIDGQAYPMRADGDRFVLDSLDNPLARVGKDVRYEVQVVDADGLGLERPVSGVLQVRADQLPRIAAATVTRFVLAEAAPQVRFKAMDDYGLSKIVVRKAVIRAADAGAQPATGADSDGGASGGTVAHQEVVTTIAEPNGKLREIGDTIKVDLTPLNLVIGDRVEVTLEAIDFRGDPASGGSAGKSTRSERMVFQVTDRKGVLDAMRELDAQMDKKLDQIIDAQLGGGGSP